LGIPLGERGVGYLDGLLRNEVTGRSGQRHRTPPVVGCDSTGYGHHTRDPSYRRRPSLAPCCSLDGCQPEFASDILTIGGLISVGLTCVAPHGVSEAKYAAIATMSSTVRLATGPFMSWAAVPARAPFWMS